MAALSSPKKSSSAAPSPSPVTTSSFAASTPSLNAQTSQTFLSTPDAFALSFEDDDIEDPEDNHSTPPGGMRQEVTGNFYPPPHQPTAAVPPPANRKSTLSTLTPARPISDAAPRPSQQTQRSVPPIGQVRYLQIDTALHMGWTGQDLTPFALWCRASQRPQQDEAKSPGEIGTIPPRPAKRRRARQQLQLELPLHHRPRRSDPPH